MCAHLSRGNLTTCRSPQPRRSEEGEGWWWGVLPTTNIAAQAAKLDTHTAARSDPPAQLDWLRCDPTPELSSPLLDSSRVHSPVGRGRGTKEVQRGRHKTTRQYRDVRALGHRVARSGRSTEGIGDREAVSGYTDTKSQSGTVRSMSETFTLDEIRLTTRPCSDPPHARESTRTHLLEALTAKTPRCEQVRVRGSTTEAFLACSFRHQREPGCGM